MFYDHKSIDLFAIMGKGLVRARPILKAQALIIPSESPGIGNPLCFGDKHLACFLVASPCKLELFSIYLHLSSVA